MCRVHHVKCQTGWSANWNQDCQNINNLRYADDTVLVAESKEELKSLLMKLKEESEKAGFKLNIQKTKIMASVPITSWQIHGETMETVIDFVFLGSKTTVNGDCSHEIKTLAPCKKHCDQPRQHIKKQRHYFTDKGPSSQSYGFSRGHVWLWELGQKENWGPKNWCFWTVVLEKTLESASNCKEIQPVHPKGNKSWIFIGRTDAEAEAPILWPPDAKSWLNGKDPDAGKGWRQKDKGMIGWDGWMAIPTPWTWVWASSGSWWWTGRPGMLQSMGSQRVGHNWVTQLNWIHAVLNTCALSLIQGPLKASMSLCVCIQVCVFHPHNFHLVRICGTTVCKIERLQEAREMRAQSRMRSHLAQSSNSQLSHLP